MSSVELKKINPKHFKPYSNIIIIGKRETGKSTVMKWILYYKHKKVVVPLVFSETAIQQGLFKGIIPKGLIHEKFDESVLNALLMEQEKLRKKDLKEISKKKKTASVILDDIGGMEEGWQKIPAIKSLFLNGRHYYADLIICIHDVMDLKPKFRQNADYIVITKLVGENSYKKFFENFWNQKFGDKKTCYGLIEKYTEGYKTLVVDCKSVNTSSDVTSSIFYMELPNPIIMPKFKLGDKYLLKQIESAEREEKE